MPLPLGYVPTACAWTGYEQPFALQKTSPSPPLDLEFKDSHPWETQRFLDGTPQKTMANTSRGEGFWEFEPKDMAGGGNQGWGGTEFKMLLKIQNQGELPGTTFHREDEGLHQSRADTTGCF